MPSFWCSGLGGRSPHFGGGGLGAPGAPQGSLQNGQVPNASTNPVGNSALRVNSRFLEYGENTGPTPMFRRGPALAMWQVIGVTRDSTGAALGNCNVDLFLYGTNAYVTSTTSDVGGNYLFSVPSNGPYYVRVTDNQGTPTVVGSSLPIQPV